ncbi:unnamed protein product [Phytomonas sp. EM1]|nr:unnamed protein product [Phytomonas sp. EM1]|eukprot:CCW63378.1 unnamed protein product [Phytomonas sp. isolate EM1]
MSDKIRELAEARRRRFQQLSKDEKPKVAVCPNCAQASYLSEICPRTGQYHDLQRKTLVGGDLFNSKFVDSSRLMGAFDRTRVKWVPSRTQLVKADAQSLNIFQSFVAQVGWNLQRYAILYGRYDSASAVVEVHAVYEPEQHGNRYRFEVIDDPRIETVDAIARGLGLRRVGALCTHPPRDPDEIVMSARELLLCAREQSLHGDECVLLTIAPNLSDGVVECQAWQTSPQCVHLFRVGLLYEPDEKDLDRKNTDKKDTDKKDTEKKDTEKKDTDKEADKVEEWMIVSKVALEVAQEDTDGKGHRLCVTKEPCTRIDTRWFTSYIAVQQFTSDVVRGGFLRISRPGMAPPTFENLRNYMNDPKRRNETFAEKIADFHVLIFLSTVFSTSDDLPELVRIAKTKEMTEEARNYEAILHEYIN